MILDPKLKAALRATARYYDDRKVGDVGALGFRRSSPLLVLNDALERLVGRGLLVPGRSLFLDMGCADGRVNVFMSYLVRLSVGVEVDEWTLEEYRPLRQGLEAELKEEGLPLPPDNVHLFHGDTLEARLGHRIGEETGVRLRDFDLFYTYLTLYEEFAGLVAREAHAGAVFLVYGLDLILPRLDGLRLMDPLHQKLAIYRKE